MSSKSSRNMPGLSGEVFLTRSKSQQPAEFEPHLKGKSRCTSTDLSFDSALVEDDQEFEQESEDTPVPQQSTLRQRLQANVSPTVGYIVKDIYVVCKLYWVLF